MKSSCQVVKKLEEVLFIRGKKGGSADPGREANRRYLV
jgi:hypothetical protein